MMQLSQYTFRELRDIFHRATGNLLPEDKSYLVQSRLAPLAEELGLKSLEELALRLRKASRHDPVLIKVVDRLTTHETSFFRDNIPFQKLTSQILPEVLTRVGADKTIRIWSAACSTGQEVYSLSITVSEFLRTRRDYSFEIVATDISPASVDIAKRGIYTDFEVKRGLSPEIRDRYFERATGDAWRVRDNLRNQITFRVDNLMQPSLQRNYFDIIFCRNVLIYFEREAKTKILENLANFYRDPAGFLVLGAAESTIGITDRFNRPSDGSFGVFVLAPRDPLAAMKRPIEVPKVPKIDFPNAASRPQTSGRRF